MKGLKKYFSPPQVNGRTVRIEKGDEFKKKEVEETQIVNNNGSGTDDLIVKNMEEVLKTINKKMKKEKHKRKHHKDKKRAKNDIVEEKGEELR